jgi:hypothetical protein
MRREIRNAIVNPMTVCRRIAPTTKISVVSARRCTTDDVMTST